MAVEVAWPPARVIMPISMRAYYLQCKWQFSPGTSSSADVRIASYTYWCTKDLSTQLARNTTGVPPNTPTPFERRRNRWRPQVPRGWPLLSADATRGG